MDDVINIKNFDPNNIKIDETSYKDLAIKDSRFFDKVSWYFEDIKGSKYIMLVPTNESKKITNKCEELWSKIGDLVRPVTTNYDYDEKYTKIKFNSDDELPLNKGIEITIMIAVVRSVFNENKYYPQLFLDECLHKL